MADEKRPQHDNPEHQHNDKLQSEYWDALVSIDRVAMLTESTCEFSMALFDLCANVLSSAPDETRAAMLKRLDENASEMREQRKAVHEVAAVIEQALRGGPKKAH